MYNSIKFILVCLCFARETMLSVTATTERMLFATSTATIRQLLNVFQKNNDKNNKWKDKKGLGWRSELNNLPLNLNESFPLVWIFTCVCVCFTIWKVI